jgi:hypothetical protein
MVDRPLLRQALGELVRLRAGLGTPSRVLGLLYTAALEEWAERLQVDSGRLHKLVMIQEAIASHRPH